MAKSGKFSLPTSGAKLGPSYQRRLKRGDPDGDGAGGWKSHSACGQAETEPEADEFEKVPLGVLLVFAWEINLSGRRDRTGSSADSTRKSWVFQWIREGGFDPPVLGFFRSSATICSFSFPV